MAKFLREASTIKQSGGAGRKKWRDLWMSDTREVALRFHLTHGGNKQRICGAEIRACAAVDWARRWEPHLQLTCLSTEGEMKGKVEREEELEQLSLVSDHGASEPHSPVQTQWQPGFRSQHPDYRREKIRPLVHFKLLHEHLLVHYHSKIWSQ